MTGREVSFYYISAFDAGNRAGNPKNTITDSGTLLPPGYSSSVFGGPVTTNNYSLTQVIHIYGNPGDQPIGTYLIDATLTAVPEPATSTLSAAAAYASGTYGSARLWRARHQARLCKI